MAWKDRAAPEEPPPRRTPQRIKATPLRGFEGSGPSPRPGSQLATPSHMGPAGFAHRAPTMQGFNAGSGDGVRIPPCQHVGGFCGSTLRGFNKQEIQGPPDIKELIPQGQSAPRSDFRVCRGQPLAPGTPSDVDPGAAGSEWGHGAGTSGWASPNQLRVCRAELGFSCEGRMPSVASGFGCCPKGPVCPSQQPFRPRQTCLASPHGHASPLPAKNLDTHTCSWVCLSARTQWTQSVSGTGAGVGVVRRPEHPPNFKLPLVTCTCQANASGTRS